jgi:hypothetical protein
MINKDSYKRIKEIFFDVVEQSICIIQEVSILKQRIGTPNRRVTVVETFAFWLNSTVDPNEVVVADPPPCAVEWTKKIRTRGTQTRADESLRQSTCLHQNE